MTLGLIEDRWPDLVTRLGNRIDLAASAHRSGAFRQGRGVPDAETLLRLALAYGGCGLSLRATCAWAEASGLARLSNPALTKRLQHCPAWLAEIAAARLANRPVRRIRLLDATTLCHPGATGASWRLHLAFDLASGRVEPLTVSDGRGGERLDRLTPERGVLDIADAADASGSRIRERLAAGGELLVRLDRQGVRLCEPAGDERFEVLEAVRAMPGPCGEWQVRVEDGPPGGPPGAPLLRRLVACRQPLEACARARRRVRERARQKQQKLDERTLEAADCVLLLTSLPAAAFPAVAVLELYRLRWQIELAFKRWKSLLDLGALPAQTAARAMSWILAKLIAILLLDAETAAWRELFPPEPDGDGAAALPVELLAAALATAPGGHPHRRPPARLVAR